MHFAFDSVTTYSHSRSILERQHINSVTLAAYCQRKNKSETREKRRDLASLYRNGIVEGRMIDSGVEGIMTGIHKHRPWRAQTDQGKVSVGARAISAFVGTKNGTKNGTVVC